MDNAVACPCEEATALLIDVEKLDTYIINLAPNEEVFVLCTVGEKNLKTAPGKIPASGLDDPISFDSLLQFPFDYESDHRVLFSLREKKSMTELGRYNFDMGLFKGQKPTRSVRIKLKNFQDKGIGFLELKMKLGSLYLERPTSLKYVKTPRAVKSWMVPNEIDYFDSDTMKQIRCAFYKVQDMRKLRSQVTFSISLGSQSVRMADLHPVTENELRTEILPIEQEVSLPYNGARFIKFTLSEQGTDDSEPFAEGEVDLLKFVTNAPANVYVGSVQLEAVRNATGTSMPQGILFFRFEKARLWIDEPSACRRLLATERDED